MMEKQSGRQRNALHVHRCFLLLPLLCLGSLIILSSRLSSREDVAGPIAPSALVHNKDAPIRLVRVNIDQSNTTIEAATASSGFASPPSAEGLQSEPTQSIAPPPSSSATRSPLIPRIIHQSWKSSDRIPARFAPWMQSWTANHPGWQYVFWTDADNLSLFEQYYPQYAYIARAVPKIALADMARYALLHLIGGLYVDADFECRRPFDGLHDNYSLFLSHEPLVHAVLLEKSSVPALCNAIMASAPGHSLWLRALELIKTKFDRERWRLDPVSLTGPRLLKETYETWFSLDATISVLPSEYFYPEVPYWNLGGMRKAYASRADADAHAACAWLDRFPQGQFTDNTHASHHWQCTWCLQDPALKQVVSLRAIFNKTAAIFRPCFATKTLTLVPYYT